MHPLIVILFTLNSCFVYYIQPILGGNMLVSKKIDFLTSLLVSFLFILNGCDIIDDIFGSNDDKDAFSYENESVAETFTSDAGGTLNTALGVTIIVPDSAIAPYTDGRNGSMIFSIELHDSVDIEAPNDETPIAPVYRFGPDGFTFARPVTIGFPAPDDIDLSKEVLSIWRINPSSGVLEEYPAIYDADLDLITTNTLHFSSYFPTIASKDGWSYNEVDLRDRSFGSWPSQSESNNFGSWPGPGSNTFGSWPGPGVIAAMRAKERGCVYVKNNFNYFVRLCVDKTNYALKYPEQDVPGLVLNGVLLEPWNFDGDNYDWYLPQGTFTVYVQYSSNLEVSPPYIAWGTTTLTINESASTLITTPVCPPFEFHSAGMPTDSRLTPGTAPCIPTPTIPVGTGDIQIQLTWGKAVPGIDLDLWVTDPNGDKCYYITPQVPSGGNLDRDNKCANYIDGRPENIFWESSPPNGEYIIEVHWYDDCGTGDTGQDYIVKRYVKGAVPEIKTYSRTIHTGTVQEVARFTIGNSKSRINEGNGKTYYPEFKLPPK